MMTHLIRFAISHYIFMLNEYLFILFIYYQLDIYILIKPLLLFFIKKSMKKYDF